MFIESLSIEEKRRIVCKIVTQLTDFEQKEAEAGFDGIKDFFKDRLLKAILETSIVHGHRAEIIKAKMAILLKDKAVGIKAITDKEISDIIFASNVPDDIIIHFFLLANGEKYLKIIEEDKPLWYIKKG